MYLCGLVHLPSVDDVLFEGVESLELGGPVFEVLHEEHTMLQPPHKLCVPCVEVGSLYLGVSPHIQVLG